MKGEGNPRPSALYCWEEGRTLRPEFVLVSLRLFSASPLVLLEVGFLRTRWSSSGYVVVLSFHRRFL